MIKQTFYRLFLCLLGLLAVTHGWAQTVPNLYQGEVPVASKSAADRAEGIRQAFAQVLVKVNGHADIVQHAPVQDSLSDASELLEEYRYHTQTSIDDTHQVVRQTFLKVDFNTDKVNHFLTQRGLNIWGADRPTILVWLLMETEQGIQVIPQHAQPATTFLQSEALKRGLMVDLVATTDLDAAQLDVEAIAAGDLAALRAASQAQAADGLMLVRVKPEPNAHLASYWQLSLDALQATWQVRNAQFQAMLNQGIDQLANRLADEYSSAEQSSEPSSVLLTVESVNSSRAYDDLTQYLKSMPTVTMVQILGVSAGQVQLQLGLDTSVSNFEQSLRFGRRLQPISTTNSVAAVAEPEYQWSQETTALPKPFQGSRVAAESQPTLFYRWVS